MSDDFAWLLRLYVLEARTYLPGVFPQLRAIDDVDWRNCCIVLDHFVCQQSPEFVDLCNYAQCTVPGRFFAFPSENFCYVNVSIARDELELLIAHPLVKSISQVSPVPAGSQPWLVHKYQIY